MRVMVLRKANEGGQQGAPTKEALAAMDRFIEEPVQAGIMVAGAGLKAGVEAKRTELTGRPPRRAN